MATGTSGLKGQGLKGQGILGGRSLGVVSETISFVTGQQYAVFPSTSYVAFYTLTAGNNAASRTVIPHLNWYQSDGVTLISSSAGSGVAITPNGSGTPHVIATSPSNAAFATIDGVMASVMSYENFEMTKAELIAGTTVPVWSAGGVIGNGTIEIQASYDGQVTWNDIRFGASVVPTNQSGSAIDYESPFNVTLAYRARMVLSTGGVVLVSVWSNVGTVTIASTYWWVLDPLTPTYGLQIMRVQISGGTVPANQNSSIIIDSVEQLGIFRGMGESTAFVVRGDIWAEEFDIGMYFANSVVWTQFNLLRARQTTLLLKSDMEGSTYFVVLGGDRPAAILSASDRTYEPQRSLAMHATPVESP